MRNCGPHLALAALTLGGIGVAQDRAAATAPAPPAIAADVVYGHKAGMALTYDVIRPAEPNGAAVLFVVSGGWRSQWVAPAQTARRLGFLLDSGFTVYAVRHGSSPWFVIPEIVADVRRAVRHVRAHAAEHGVDPDRIGVFGGSAGGHLAMLLATTADDGDAAADDPVERVGSRVRTVVAWYPPVDLRGLVPAPGADGSPAQPNERYPALNFDPELAGDLSPILHVTPDDAPSLLIHGDRDPLVPLSHSERMRQALADAGVASELVVIEGAGHGFRGADLGRVQRTMVEWFSTHLLGASSRRD